MNVHLIECFSYFYYVECCVLLQIQLTLDEHEAVLAEKARELADMIGKVSIKTVDTSEFDDGAIRLKGEVQEEGYLGGKVEYIFLLRLVDSPSESTTGRDSLQSRKKNVF